MNKIPVKKTTWLKYGICVFLLAACVPATPSTLSAQPPSPTASVPTPTKAIEPAAAPKQPLPSPSPEGEEPLPEPDEFTVWGWRLLLLGDENVIDRNLTLRLPGFPRRVSGAGKAIPGNRSGDGWRGLHRSR